MAFVLKVGEEQETCFNETYSKIHVVKRLFDACSMYNNLKRGDALLRLPFNFVVEYATRMVQKSRETGIDLDTLAVDL